MLQRRPRRIPESNQERRPLALAPLVLALLLARTAVAQPTNDPQAPPEVPALPAAATLQPGDAPDAAKRSRTLALLPLKLDLAAPGDLFAPDAPRPHEATLAATEALLVRLLQAQPYVALKPVAQVRAELAQDPRAQPVAASAQHHYRLGLDLYLGLSTPKAAENLKRAADLYRGVYQDVVDPKPVADAQLMYGVALHDLGREAASHIALKDAFGLQPDRRFRPSFFPPQVNTALVNALVDHQSSADPVHPYGDNARMTALAQRLGVSALVLGTLRPGTDGPELRLAIFGAQRRVIEAETRLPARGAEARIDAFLSRWLACVPVTLVTPTPVEPRRETRIDAAGAYALHLLQPPRRDFHSLGFAVGLSRDVRPGLELFGRVRMYTSLSDPYRDLLHAFNSVRLQLGLGYALRRGPVRLFVRPGFDVHVLGSFVTTEDPDCKLFGVQHKLCDRDTLFDLDQRVLMGLDLALGTQVHIGRNFFVVLQGSVASYFLPLDGTDRLNFPVSGELGLGYSL